MSVGLELLVSPDVKMETKNKKLTNSLSISLTVSVYFKMAHRAADPRVIITALPQHTAAPRSAVGTRSLPLVCVSLCVVPSKGWRISEAGAGHGNNVQIWDL